MTSANPANPALRRRRLVACGVLRDERGGVLLARASAHSSFAGAWFLPGAGIGQGEDAADAVARGVAAQAGLAVEVTGPRAATADVVDLPHLGVSVYTVRVIFDLRLRDGMARVGPGDGPGDGIDEVRFVQPEEAGELVLMPFVAEVFGLRRPIPPSSPPRSPPRDPLPFDAAEPGSPAVVTEPGSPAVVTGPVPRQRPAVYAVILQDDCVLLTRLTGTDWWLLPGGGIDHGETPMAALIREVHEEAGLVVDPGPLVSVSSRHLVTEKEDFHGVRMVFVGSVSAGSQPRVVEVGGSTDAVEWVPLARLRSRPLMASVDLGLDAVLGPDWETR